MFIFRGFTTNFGEQFFCTSVGHMQWFMGLVHLGGLTFRQESRGSLFVVYKHLTVNVSLSHRHWLKHKYKEAVLTYIILLYTAIWKEMRTDRKLKDCGYMLNLFSQGWEKKKNSVYKYYPTERSQKSLFHFIVQVYRSVLLGIEVIKNNKNFKNNQFDLLFSLQRSPCFMWCNFGISICTGLAPRHCGKLLSYCGMDE